MTSALVVLALLTGTTVSVWQAIEANRAGKVADERLTLADDRLRSEQQTNNPELSWQLGQVHLRLAFLRAEMGEPQAVQTHYEQAREIQTKETRGSTASQCSMVTAGP